MKSVIPKTVFLLFCLALSSNAFAATDYVVGVKEGDWIKHTVSVTYGTVNVQTWTRITIKTVNGTRITGIYETGVAGQQTVNQTFSYDISTGSGLIGGFIVPANLTVGQPIPGESTTVKEIVDWHGRKAVTANATSPYLGLTAKIYWDQATGVLLEASGEEFGSSFTISASETNMWGGGLGWLTWVVIIVVIVVVVAVVGVFVLRRKKPAAPLQVQPPPPPPPPPMQLREATEKLAMCSALDG